MKQGLRKFTLTAHVTTSVGWLGAVAVFIVLAVIGLTSEDEQLMRACYLAMEPITWFVLVPLALISLLTGLVCALGTTWGLFRHYWVIFKLLLNAFATIVLLLYTQTVGYIARAAADPVSSNADLRELGASPLLHAGAALLLLIVAAGLAVYKPRGMTRYGRRKQRERISASAAPSLQAK